MAAFFDFSGAEHALAVGNIGSSIKMDYTVLGNTVDEAMHLAAFARDMKHAIAIDKSILPNADASWGFLPVGDFEFSDLNQLITIYTLANFEDRKLTLADPG